MKNRIEIELDGYGHGTVKVDGVEVPRVRLVEICGEAGEPARARIEIAAVPVSVSAMAEVEQREVGAERPTMPSSRDVAELANPLKGLGLIGRIRKAWRRRQRARHRRWLYDNRVIMPDPSADSRSSITQNKRIMTP